MTFRTITVFEKPDVQLEAELWATPGWFKFSQCFLYDGNPYISNIDLKLNQEGSYLEYYIDYHNAEAYQAWYDEWKHVHDDLRVKIIANLKSRGIESQLYWPDEDQCPFKEDDVFLASDFTSKIPTNAS
jgi:hypothetical protein